MYPFKRWSKKSLCQIEFILTYLSIGLKIKFEEYNRNSICVTHLNYMYLLFLQTKITFFERYIIN